MPHPTDISFICSRGRPRWCKAFFNHWSRGTDLTNPRRIIGADNVLSFQLFTAVHMLLACAQDFFFCVDQRRENLCVCVHVFMYVTSQVPDQNGVSQLYNMLFFFFAFPSYISGVHRFLVRFLRMWPLFNPSIKVVTFRLRGWCVLGVFLLPAFTRLGHERQDLLSPCDEMHVCTD